MPCSESNVFLLCLLFASEAEPKPVMPLSLVLRISVREGEGSGRVVKATPVNCSPRLDLADSEAVLSMTSPIRLHDASSSL